MASTVDICNSALNMLGLIKRIDLAANTETPNFQWKFQFTLPSDCLRVLRTENSNFSNEEQYRIEGRNLLTNQSTIKIQYVAKITDTTKYDTLLIETISARLAAELCYPITQSATLMDRMFALYDAKLKEARFADATEGSSDDDNRLQAGDFINARL